MGIPDFLFFRNIAWRIVTSIGLFDKQMFFLLFFWSTRDHSSLVRSTYEEHLDDVVALTSSERGTQFHPLFSCAILHVRWQLIILLLFLLCYCTVLYCTVLYCSVH